MQQNSTYLLEELHDRNLESDMIKGLGAYSSRKTEGTKYINVREETFLVVHVGSYFESQKSGDFFGLRLVDMKQLLCLYKLGRTSRLQQFRKTTHFEKVKVCR